MKVEYRMWNNIERPLAGKMVLRPETPEEQTLLQAFRQHVGSPQHGRKFEIIFRRRVIGPEMIKRVLDQKESER